MSESSEIGEMYRELRKERQEKREQNRESSLQILMQTGLNVTVKNDGAHLIVKSGKTVVDFWPGTGLYIKRGTNKRRRGVRNLIHELCPVKDSGKDVNENRQ